MSLRDVAIEGDRLTTLRALRDDLARWLDETDSGRDRASLSLRFTDVLAQIAELEGAAPSTGEGGTGLDELNARRADREARAARQA